MCVDVRYVDVLVCGCTCVDVCVRGCVCVCGCLRMTTELVGDTDVYRQVVPGKLRGCVVECAVCLFLES